MPTSTSSVKSTSSSNRALKAQPIPKFSSNSNANAAVITTQFPPKQTRAASEPKESTTNLKLPPSPSLLIRRLTPTPPLPLAVNGHIKKSTPPGTLTQNDVQSTTNKTLPSSIFVPPPTVPDTSNVRIGPHIEVGRLEMEDLAKQELNNVHESYINDLIEEVIQSDFEKPSIPEVILAVITDLTNDDDDDNNNNYNEHNMDQQYFNDLNQIYNFSQDKMRSTSLINYNNGANADIDNYYTRVHQTVTNANGLNNQDSAHNTTSSNQSTVLASAADAEQAYLPVKFLLK